MSFISTAAAVSTAGADGSIGGAGGDYAPVRNEPIINCSTVTPTVPTSFVADPFLLLGKCRVYVFYEFKNKVVCEGRGLS